MIYKKNRKGLLQYLGIPHHEYWSWWWFSVPIWPQWIWYAIRLKNATWFTAVNPGIEHSGYTEESKRKIMDILPKENLPKTIYLSPDTALPDLLLPFPFIAKPDIGGRGRKVKIIDSCDEMMAYHTSVKEDYMIQEIIPYGLELGVFYARMPSEPKGKIISLTEKGFLKVKGDGQRSVRELLKSNARAIDHLKRLAQTIDLDHIPKENEEFVAEPIGNHCRGTVFLNRADKITQQVEDSFNRIATQIKGFYYGRFDIRVKSWEDFYEGKNTFILELNGLTSMDSHIFDPAFRLRDVLPVMIKNCRLCYRIAKENLKNNIPSSPLPLIIKKSFAFLKE